MSKSSSSSKAVTASTPTVEAVGTVILTPVAVPLSVALPEGSVALYVGGAVLPQSATFPLGENGSPLRWITSAGWGPALQEEWDLVKRSRSADPRAATIARRALAQSFLGRLALVPKTKANAWGMRPAVDRLLARLSEDGTVLLGGFRFADVQDLRGLVLYHLVKRAATPFTILRNDGQSLGPVGEGVVRAIGTYWEIA